MNDVTVSSLEKWSIKHNVTTNLGIAGQEDQGTLKKLLTGFPVALLPLPGAPGLPSSYSLGSLELPPGRYFLSLM